MQNFHKIKVKIYHQPIAPNTSQKAGNHDCYGLQLLGELNCIRVYCTLIFNCILFMSLNIYAVMNLNYLTLLILRFA